MLEKTKHINKIDESTPIIYSILSMKNSDYRVMLKAKYTYLNENDIIVKNKSAIKDK